MSTQLARDLATVRRRSSWSRRLSRVESTALAAGVALLALLAVVTLLPAGRGVLRLDADVTVPLVAAAAVYVLGHLLRALRLAVLVKEPVVGTRGILSAHVLTSGLGLLLPFKLGDLVRMRVLGVLMGSTTRGAVAVILERSLDVGVIIAISLVAAATTAGSTPLVTPLLVVSVVFVLATVAAVTVVPDYLRAVSLHLVRRSDTPRHVRLVVALERVMVVLDEAPKLLRRRTATLVVLTGLVWLAELAALALAVPVLAADLARLSTALASFLSSLSSGAVALIPGALERALGHGQVLAGVDEVRLEGYRVVLVVPLIWGSALAGFLVRDVLLGRRATVRRQPAW